MINKTVGIVLGFLAAGLMFGCAKKSNINVENAVEPNLPNESTDISENAAPTLVEDAPPFIILKNTIELNLKRMVLGMALGCLQLLCMGVQRLFESLYLKKQNH